MSLLRFPDSAALLSPSCAGSVDYWGVLCAFGKVVVDDEGRFDKRLKSTHRCDIADVNGLMSLTVPVEKPVSMTAARWSDIRLSSHGEWWHQHRVAMESAYGATPFFEYYAPEFEPFWRRDSIERFPTVTAYDGAMTAIIARILGCETEILHSAETIGDAPLFDFRGKHLPTLEPVRYYQVREQELGFIPHLSVLDLIFNMGPESPLMLKQMTENFKPDQI